jgi:hypothetical protein
MSPNRERSGEVSSPARVVAPMREKGLRDSRTDRAPAPRSIMISRLKSSIAG